MMLEQLSQLFRPLSSFWEQNRRSPKTVPIIAIVVTVLLIIIFKLAQPEPPVKTKEEKSWTVQTHQLVEGVKSPQLELYGQVESPYTATITAYINADVLSLDVKEGEEVSKGQLLIKLDELDVKLILDQRLSDVAELEASIESEKNRHNNDLASLKLEKSLVALAEKKLAREEKTSKSNLTSQSSFDTQKQALQNQKLALKARQLSVTNHPARLAQLEAKLAHKRALAQQAETDLQRATVLSPFDGIVLSTSVSPGERVRPGEELLQLYSTENIELRAQLPQKHVDTVKDALARELELTAQVMTAHRNIDVLLHRVSGAMAETGVGVDALFEIKAEDADYFTMGEVLEVVLELPAIHGVYSIPVSSIYGTNRIYTVDKDRLVAVKVEKSGTQIKDGKQYILVRSDKLKPGDEVITTQLPHAMTGLKVEVYNTAPADTGIQQESESSGES
jgi:multidrug efflux pump subunit AcrA (membrane-fusion protein)